jgi:hypothetical protein
MGDVMIHPYDLEKHVEKLRAALREAEATLSHEDVLFFDTARVVQALATKAALEHQLGEHERRVEAKAEAERVRREEDAELERRYLAALEADPELRREVKQRNWNDGFSFPSRSLMSYGTVPTHKWYGPLPGGFPDELRKRVRHG